MPRTISPSSGCSRMPGRSFIGGMIERIALSQGGRVTSVDPATNDHRHRIRQLHRRCRQRHSAAEGRPHRRARRRCRPHRLVPDRSGDVRVEARAEHSRHRRCLPRRRHSEIGVRRKRTRQGLRRRDRQPACRQAAGDAAADRRLLQHCRARLGFSLSGNYQPEGRRSSPRSRAAAHQPGRCAARASRPRGD